MSSAAKKEKTVFEKWMGLPQNVIGEIINGELFANPRPSPGHGAANYALGVELGGPFHMGKGGGPGGWRFMMEPEIHIDQNIFVPDLAGWRRERIPEMPKDPFFTIVPDWICEVLSPSTVRYDRATKMPLYANLEVKYLWLIDPVAKTLEIFLNDHKRWTLIHTYANEDKIRAIPFDAIEIEMKVLWD